MPVDDLPIVLDRRGPEPLAVQVADALRSAAGSGALRVGDRLSSTRALAARLGVSRTVTAAAYDQLLAEGWLAGRRGSGTFVTAAPPAATAVQLQSAPGPTTPAATSPRRTPTAEHDDGAGLLDLTAGRPCLAVLDRAAWRRAWRAAADQPPTKGPSYAGHAGFRRAVVDHLLRHRGLTADPGQLLATSGTTDGLDELAAALPAGARVALEEPGYQRAAATLTARGLHVVPAAVDENGLRVEDLPPGLAAVYCTPAHQFPLGSRLSAGRRVALVERARAEGFLVIEDDYDGELRYDVAPLPLLAALGPDVVAYLGTTSKLLTPALGAGWLVAPPVLHERLLAARDRAAIRPSPAGQLVFTAFAEYGDLARHLRRLRAELTERRCRIVTELAGTEAPVLGDAAGGHLRIGLPSAEAERAVVTGAEAAGVLVPGLREYHRRPARVFGVSIGYAGPSRAELDTAVRVVAGLVERAWASG
ncbi:MAG TPA: PLP-dependent aminotransferase family protein [Pseudonocardia sp.]|nr:PLP-dependent aminotransferase family protein [Pseudonocardia sp.]